MPHEIDPAFSAYPMRMLADAALQHARDLGAEHADFRFERIRSQSLSLRDGNLEGSHDGEDVGFGVRVLHKGTWGFAAAVDLTPEEAVQVAERAVELAKVARKLSPTRVEIADEPVHPDAVWISGYEVDPFTVPDAEKIELMAGRSRQALAHPAVDHITARLDQVLENKFYADTAGTVTTQQRIRVQPVFEALGTDTDSGRFETMGTLAPPAGRGWEYVTGDDGVVAWDDALGELGPTLVEKLAAPSVDAGRHDLVVDPTNLWLTIHESVGHATELDRALGYEANYAGTSFATLDQLGKLRYGSPAMQVTGDRTAPHGLATIGYDDEGVQAQSWDIVRDGMLVGYQLDRAMARANAGPLGTSRSNGCAFADSPGHVPVQRMANVSLRPADDGPSTEELIGRVDDGIYVVGNKSWSIDMQRYNFQFTGQRFYRIRNGRLDGQLRDVAYQATTTEFWGSLEAVGGPQTYQLGGAFNCGKAQPGQLAPVSHGCPTVLFRDINILNTAREGGQ